MSTVPARSDATANQQHEAPSPMILVHAETLIPVGLPYYGRTADGKTFNVYDYRDDGKLLASYDDGPRLQHDISRSADLLLISEREYMEAQRG
jgi:hypothetical protein